MSHAVSLAVIIQPRRNIIDYIHLANRRLYCLETTIKPEKSVINIRLYATLPNAQALLLLSVLTLFLTMTIAQQGTIKYIIVM